MVSVQKTTRLLLIRRASLVRSLLMGMFILLLACSTAKGDEKGEVDHLGVLTVKSTRVDKSLYEVPYAINFVDRDDIQLARQQVGLDEALLEVPGVFMQNRYNFAQDLRIAIRGFGARATFGIRGVKLFVDGIPATLPDGQGGVDSIDIGSLDRIEILRGPVSSLYGAASGGVINMYTEDGPSDGHMVEARTSYGSYHYRKHQLKCGGQKNKLNYLLNVSRLDYGGYRDHSDTETSLLNTKIRYDINGSSDFSVTLNAIDSPEANDPGGLVRDGDARNVDISTPRAAQKNNLLFDAGESVRQQKAGVLYRKSLGQQQEFSLRNYYIARDFRGRLPFGDFTGEGVEPSGGIVDLQRFVVGGGGQYTHSQKVFGHDNRLTLGVDLDRQMDERKNYTNIIESSVVGPKSLDQDEDIFAWGIYLQNEFKVTESLELTLGARYDEVSFDFDDQYLADGTDNSGKIVFSELSPMAGLLWSPSDIAHFYGNIGRSFETPSSRELANPSGGGGFNGDLEPQTATSIEVGVKGLLSSGFSYTLSAFHIETDNELIVAGKNPVGSDYYENAGETTRKGVEASLKMQPFQGLSVSLAYTYSDFKFEQFTDDSGRSFDGNKIPGIPQHHSHIGLEYYHPSGFFAGWETQYVDELYVNNANSDKTWSYALSNLRMAYTVYYKNLELGPFFGINNVFNKEYIGAVRINESNNRFFEPAPDRNIYGGIRLKVNI